MGSSQSGRRYGNIQALLQVEAESQDNSQIFPLKYFQLSHFKTYPPIKDILNLLECLTDDCLENYRFSFFKSSTLPSENSAARLVHKLLVNFVLLRSDFAEISARFILFIFIWNGNHE